MTSPELFLISIMRVLAEVAGFSLIGQGVLAVLAGKLRDTNVVYRLMQTISSPAVRLVRFITPRAIIDRHVPFVTFFLLFWLWIGLAVAKRYVCVTKGLQCL
ncbi:MAG TPA: hypothetical protein VGP12_02900 [Nitrosospira sp.]|jgi:hypothetical protein|nr:hypothetical protein [Nitrosospira sp.]